MQAEEKRKDEAKKKREKEKSDLLLRHREADKHQRDVVAKLKEQKTQETQRRDAEVKRAGLLDRISGKESERKQSHTQAVDKLNKQAETQEKQLQEDRGKRKAEAKKIEDRHEKEREDENERSQQISRGEPHILMSDEIRRDLDQLGGKQNDELKEMHEQFGDQDHTEEIENAFRDKSLEHDQQNQELSEKLHSQGRGNSGNDDGGGNNGGAPPTPQLQPRRKRGQEPSM